MAWRALLCCLLAEVATAETASCSPSEDEETAQRTSFVQMAKHLEKHLESREAALPGVCLRSLSWEIYRKPIQEVLKDHPNYDGWCIYGIMGELFSKCAVAREVRQLVPFTDVIQKKESPMHLGRTQRFVLEGSEVNVDRMHVLDDLYCHVNGWYELSSEAASNYSYVEEASKKYCQSLEEKVPGYRTMSLADVTKISGENEDWLASLRQDLVHLPQKVSNGLLALGAAKCLMSGTGSAAICDMAHCAKKKEEKLMLQQKKIG